MIAIERMVQKIYPGKWAELTEIDKRYDEIERRMGFPAKKRYQCIIGQYDQNTIVIERQWGSLAEMESTYEIDKLNQFLNEEVEDKKIARKKNEEEE